MNTTKKWRDNAPPGKRDVIIPLAYTTEETTIATVLPWVFLNAHIFVESS